MEFIIVILFILFIYVKIDDYNARNRTIDKVKRGIRKDLKEQFDKEWFRISDEENLYQKDKTQKKKFNYQSWLKKKRKYLQSKAWKDKRHNRLVLDNYECKVCAKNKSVNINDRLEIHHLTYKRLTKETMRDLVTLCREHHQLQHDHHGYYIDGYHKLIYK